MSGALMSWEMSCCRCSTGALHWLPLQTAVVYVSVCFTSSRCRGKRQTEAAQFHE